MRFHQRLPTKGATLGPDLKIAEDVVIHIPEGEVELVHYTNGQRLVIGHSKLTKDEAGILAESVVTHPEYIRWLGEPAVDKNFSLFMGPDDEQRITPKEAVIIPQHRLGLVQKFSIKKFLDKE